MHLVKNFVKCGAISFGIRPREEVLFAEEDEMEEEFRVKAPCVSRKGKGALKVKSDQEALQTAEKL